MSLPSRPVMKTGAGADLAFAVVLLASYLATFSSLQTASTYIIILMITLGIAYISIGIYGYGFCARSDKLWLHLIYFAIQIPLGGLIVYLAKGAGFNALILLPLAGHSVMLLSQNWMLLVNAIILGVYVLAVLLFASDWSVVFSGLPIFVAGQVFIVAFTQMALNEEKARREVERLLGELEVANQQLREYAMQVEELAITRERNRLAREIHDGLGHYLTTIHMQMQAARALNPGSKSRTAEILATVQNLAQEALADVRSSVAALRLSPEEGLPLPQRIRQMLNSYDLSGMEINLKIVGAPCHLSPPSQLTLYRTVQEGLNNVSKHASASSVWVTLDYSSDSTVNLQVRDDGKGASEMEGGGFGLLGIKERALLLNGEFRVETAPGKGFCLIVAVPK
jgi:signal transduction histidine kinase